MKVKSPRNTVPNSVIIAYALLGFLLGMLISYVLWGYNYNVSAKVKKIDVCHIDGKSGNSQTLNLPEDTAHETHLNIHDLDYEGKCAECGEGQYDDHGTCKDKVHVCLDEKAQNYDSDFDERTEVEDSESCVYPTPTPKPPKDYCKNFEGKQKEIPYGMVSIDGICSCAEGYHQVDKENGEDTLKKKEYDTFTCEKDEEPTPTPTPTPEPSSEPTVAVSQSIPSAPTCGDTRPDKTLANFHIYRKGDQAEAKWLPDETTSWKVNIYYKQVDAGNWQYSLIGTDDDGTEIINGLGGLDITFAGQYLNGCAGGDLTSPVVDGNTPGWVLFR